MKKPQSSPAAATTAISSWLTSCSEFITIITGGSGREFARRFTQECVNQSICASSRNKLKETVTQCEESDIRALPIICDVSKSQELRHLTDETVKEFGRIDILVNNAVTVKPGTPFEEQIEADVMQVSDSSSLATWRLMQYCFPHMKEWGGHIVNFGSPAGITGKQSSAAYGAMKEVIRNHSRATAREWGKYSITINCVAPTAITLNIQAILDTRPEGQRSPETLGYYIPPTSYPGSAFKDIAPVAVFLCSDDAKYITGQTIRADGGGSIFAV